MIRHSIDLEKCRGCGKCLESCGLDLWELIEADGGKKKARPVPEAAEVCNCCKFCQVACPEEAIIIIDE